MMKNLKLSGLNHCSCRINGIDGAPYSYLADESGIIEYKGVVFVCDNEANSYVLVI